MSAFDFITCTYCDPIATIATQSPQCSHSWGMYSAFLYLETRTLNDMKKNSIHSYMYTVLSFQGVFGLECETSD